MVYNTCKIIEDTKIVYLQKNYLMLRIKEVARKKSKTLDDVSKGLDICYSSLYRRMGNPKFSTLQEIANFLKR